MSKGFIVKTKTGATGRTFHKKGLINGKVPVYLSDGGGYSDKAILCDMIGLKQIGFID